MKSAAHRGLVIAVICLAALIIILWHLVPVAHDREHPELDSWYRGLHADDGAWCCDGADANHLADVDWESHAGHYRIRVDGRWWTFQLGL